MTTSDTLDAFGKLVAPDTLRIERLMPGPIDRVWSYLIDGDKRRKWLAAGEMPQAPGGEFTLTWRNDELTSPPGARPDGFSTEHSMKSRVVEMQPPHRLVFTWGEAGEVSIDLVPEGDRVHLTLVHTRIAERPARIMIGAGWHAHLDVLAARLGGDDCAPFWDTWQRLRAEYDARLPG
jgi:uncharacterized protein YndB with AHSA1/START domain